MKISNFSMILGGGGEAVIPAKRPEGARAGIEEICQRLESLSTPDRPLAVRGDGKALEEKFGALL